MPAYQQCGLFDPLGWGPAKGLLKKRNAPCPPVRYSLLGPKCLIGCSPSAYSSVCVALFY